MAPDHEAPFRIEAEEVKIRATPCNVATLLSFRRNIITVYSYRPLVKVLLIMHDTSEPNDVKDGHLPLS